MRDVSRRTETIEEFFTSITLLPGVNIVSMPPDILRVHRLEYVPTGESQNTVYPINLTTYAELDQVWGIMQNSPMNYPSYAAFWGFAPNMKMKLYPVPSQSGSLNVFYYRLPKKATADTDIIEVRVGWEDLIVLYCEYVARRKDRDPTWQEAKVLYEEKLEEMINVTRQWHDQAQVITVGNSAIPQWLYSFDGGGYGY